MGVIEAMGMDRRARVRRKALEALEKSDVTEVFETAGIDISDESAGAAMKAVLAERLAEYTIRAMREAKRRRMKLGAAAVIIASQQK